MTPLANFMTVAGLTDKALAALVSRDRTTITKLRRGQTTPSLEVALKINALSDGAVPPTAYPMLRKPKRNGGKR